MMNLYGVVNIDIVNSKNIKARGEFQKKLSDYILQVNEQFRDILAAPISITLGDEWQIITDTPEECYHLVHVFQEIFWMEDIELYAGIGIGSLSTPIYNDVRMMDGECFRAARDAINIAKKKTIRKDKHIYSIHNRVFFKGYKDEALEDVVDNILTEGSENILSDVFKEVAVTNENIESTLLPNGLSWTFVQLINTLIENNEILKSKMSKKQKEIYIDYKQLGSYRKIIDSYGADKKGSVGAISQKLNTAEYFTIQRNYEMVKLLFNHFCLLKGVAN